LNKSEVGNDNKSSGLLIVQI